MQKKDFLQLLQKTENLTDVKADVILSKCRSDEALDARYTLVYAMYKKGFRPKKIANSSEPRMMMIFGNAERWAFRQMTEKDINMALQWLEKVEAVQWYNYLSPAEAKMIDATLVNQNGKIGGHWTMEQISQAVKSLGGNMELPPYYNDYALGVTMNMIYSDHAKSIAEDMGFATPDDVPADKMVLSVYKKAVEKLCDTDRRYFIRKYFWDLLQK